MSGEDDLFWALRGGGGSFAVVTALRLRARRISRAAYFRVTYPAAAPPRRWLRGTTSRPPHPPI